MPSNKTNLDITSADNNLSSVPTGFGVDISPSGDPATISAATIQTDFLSGNVTLSTLGSPDHGEPGDITVDAGNSISTITSATFELDAAGSIALNDGVGIGNGAVVLNAQG